MRVEEVKGRRIRERMLGLAVIKSTGMATETMRSNFVEGFRLQTWALGPEFR